MPRQGAFQVQLLVNGKAAVEHTEPESDFKYVESTPGAILGIRCSVDQLYKLPKNTDYLDFLPTIDGVKINGEALTRSDLRKGGNVRVISEHIYMAGISTKQRQLRFRELILAGK